MQERLRCWILPEASGALGIVLEACDVAVRKVSPASVLEPRMFLKVCKNVDMHYEMCVLQDSDP